MPIYILNEQNRMYMGAASKWWLHHSLTKLNQSLQHKLNVYRGEAQTIILNLIKQYDVSAVYWNTCYETIKYPDTSLEKQLEANEIECKQFNGSLLWEPQKIVKKDGTPYKLYTPFYQKGCLQASQPPRAPLTCPANLTLKADKNNANTIETLALLPKINWYQGIASSWQVGEIEAQNKLVNFLDNGLFHYKELRNLPAKPNVSRLSPHLHFGEISPNQIWYSVLSKEGIQGWAGDVDYFLRELAWREFSYYTLYYSHDLSEKNFKSKFDHFPWNYDVNYLSAWQQGQTGYPFIDAGMRELWQTGYMHNRLRMITASFLTKNLLHHWHHGRDWFWDCLVDADLANNSMNWQWVAGSGVDAAPYFRIFNPVTQGEKLDPLGEYSRRFVPELDRLPARYFFKPWEATASVLKNAGIILGKTYPKPIVDLRYSREQALRCFRIMNSSVKK